jgi:hypothetical protein
VSTDNGHPTDMIPFTLLTRKAFSRHALAIVKSEPRSLGKVVIEVNARGLQGGKIVLNID